MNSPNFLRRDPANSALPKVYMMDDIGGIKVDCCAVATTTEGCLEDWMFVWIGAAS